MYIAVIRETRGCLEQYDAAVEQITTKSDKKLVKTVDKQYFAITTSEDPVMMVRSVPVLSFPPPL
jgi:hypothetical protein